MSYEETRLVMTLIQDKAKREGLAEVLESQGWRMVDLRSPELEQHAEPEAVVLEEMPTQPSVEVGVASVEQTDASQLIPKTKDSATQCGPDGGDENCPPLTITTQLGGEGGQSYRIYGGGAWGISVTPYRVS